MECISTGGWAIDPFIIILAKVFLEKLFDNNLDYIYALSNTGYIDDYLAIQWLYHFDRHTRGKQQGQYRLLIFDGHGSHITYEFICICE